jgi:cytosine/adenosine deaminase-related metal-dependent hydrolase
MPINFTPHEESQTRIRLGDVATKFVERFAGDGEEITGEILEAAIIAMQKQNREMRASIEIHEAVPVMFPRKIIERETDQLFYEIKKLLEAQHQQNLDQLNGIRLILTTCAKASCSDEVLEVIAELNYWLDKTIKPMPTHQQLVEMNKGISDREKAKHEGDFAHLRPGSTS